MSSRLYRIQNWETLADRAHWSVKILADLCHVSVRTLEVHFGTTMNESPKAWLTARRQRRAAELFQEGWSVKEVATCLGYKHPTHLSREFKKYWGYRPMEARFSAVTGE